MRHLQLENADLRDSLDDTWSNVTAIREALTTFKAEREAAGLDKTREIDSVIAEVKVLQGLIEQFSVAKSAKPKLPSVEQSPAPKSSRKIPMNAGRRTPKTEWRGPHPK